MITSKRAARLSGGFMPEYIAENFERAAEAYDLTTNPGGYISLCVAENKLMWDVMAPKIAASREIPPSVMGYDDMSGSKLFKTQVADFLGRRLLGRSIDPEMVQVVNGAGSALDLVFYAIADPGDAILVPTPSYAGFWMDIEGRDELKIIPVHCSSDDGFRLTTGHLDQAFENADAPVRALLFTTPNNPLGTVYTTDEIDEIVSWCRSQAIHVVFDEIYGLSIHGDRSFVSVAQRVAGLGDDIHIVWAFSKDFSASGLRCGVVISENEVVRATVEALAYWSAVSGDTQHLLGNLITDRTWADGYITQMQQRLGGSYRAATKRLANAGIPFHAAEAGFFFLIDLRAYLDEPSWSAEDRLWRRLMEANVNITPGAACRIEEPGFMRLCFAAVPRNVLEVGVDRIVSVLTGG